MPTTTASEVTAALNAVIEDVERNQQIFGMYSLHLLDIAKATRNLDAKVDKRVGELKTEVETGFGRVDLEFGLVNEKLNRIDARIEKLVGYIERDERKGRGSPGLN